MKQTVLILEDDFFISMEMADIVVRHLSAIPIVVTRAHDALKVIANDAREIAFALLDIEVIDGHSYPVAKKLNEMNIPFVFVSGTEPDRLPPDLQDAPFIPKPASTPRLVQLAKSLCSAGS